MRWYLEVGTLGGNKILKVELSGNGLIPSWKRSQKSLLSSCHHVRNKKLDVCDLEKRSYRTWPWPWISSFQSCEKEISIVYKPSRLSYFAMAAWADQDTELVSVHSFSLCCWWAAFLYPPILLTQRRMSQTSASWRSSHSWGSDPWQGLRVDVGLPDQLCVFCDPVFELCFLCYGAIPPDTAVALQTLSFFPHNRGHPYYYEEYHSRPLGNLWALPFQPSHSVLGLGLFTVPWGHV